MAKKKLSAPPPPPPKAPADKGYRVSVDLVEDPDFILRFADSKTALEQIDKIITRGYAIQDQREVDSNRYEVIIYPLHRIRKLSLYKG